MSITLQANCANVSVRVFLYVASRFADNEQISFGNNFDGNNTTETTATKLQNSLHFKLKSVRDTEVTPSDSTLELFRNSWHPVGSSYFFCGCPFFSARILRLTVDTVLCGRVAMAGPQYLQSGKRKSRFRHRMEHPATRLPGNWFLGKRHTV